MAKRKFNGETPLPDKRAKLHRQVNPDEQISDTYTPDSLLSSLASPERPNKRKRTTVPESNTPEAVEIKRARKNSSEPPDPSPEQDLDSEQDSAFGVWPGIGYHPSEEGPKWYDERCLRSYQQFLLFERAYDEFYNEDNMPADEPNPLPSPEPSDGDAAEGDEWEFPTANPEQAQHPIPILGQDLDSEQDSDSEQYSPEQNSDLKEWPGVQDVPRVEGSNGVLRYYERSYHNHLLSEQAYNEGCNEDNMPANEPNPLRNPKPSDRDAAETVSPNQARHSAINPYRIFSPPPLRKLDTIPPRRKRRQPLKESKNKRKQSKPKEEAFSPAVKAFLRSKRSSRRDCNRKLWHLGDDGMACEISRVR